MKKIAKLFYIIFVISIFMVGCSSKIVEPTGEGNTVFRIINSDDDWEETTLYYIDNEVKRVDIISRIPYSEADIVDINNAKEVYKNIKSSLEIIGIPFEIIEYKEDSAIQKVTLDLEVLEKELIEEILGYEFIVYNEDGVALYTETAKFLQNMKYKIVKDKN